MFKGIPGVLGIQADVGFVHVNIKYITTVIWSEVGTERTVAGIHEKRIVNFSCFGWLLREGNFKLCQSCGTQIEVGWVRYFCIIV